MRLQFREIGEIDAIRAKPPCDQRQIGITDRVIVAQNIGAGEIVLFNHGGIHRHVLCHLGGHRGLCRRVIRPACAAMLVRMGNMHGRGQEHVEGLRPCQRKRVARRQIGMWVGLRDVEKDRRVFRQDAVRGGQRRHPPFRVDGQEFGFCLLAGGEIDLDSIERRAGIMKQDMRRIGTGFS